MQKILICDDEPDITSALKIYLETAGYETVTEGNGAGAVRAVEKGGIDLVLLDVMMPVMDGIEAMKLIREFSNVPIILLTAKSEDADKIFGLTTGADDYITKPFGPMELIARVKAQLRRYTVLGGDVKAMPSSIIRVGGIEMDDRTRSVMRDGEEIVLTKTQYDMLRLFMTHPDEVLTPKFIYREVWGSDPYGSEGTVAVHIRHLREKLEYDSSNPRYLLVVWGQGYKLASKRR